MPFDALGRSGTSAPTRRRSAISLSSSVSRFAYLRCRPKPRLICFRSSPAVPFSLPSHPFPSLPSTLLSFLSSLCPHLAVTYPLGKLAARTLPSRRLLGFDLNPGPFSIKEHVLIGVLAKSGNGAAYASDIVAVLDLFFSRELHALAGITLLLTTQLIGFGLVSLGRVRVNLHPCGS